MLCGIPCGDSKRVLLAALVGTVKDLLALGVAHEFSKVLNLLVSISYRLHEQAIQFGSYVLLLANDKQLD